MNTLEYRQISTKDITLRQETDKPTTISGYASVFNSTSLDLGGFSERIQPGAFTASLASDNEVWLLIGHDMSPLNVLGKRSTGNLSLSEDDKGLRFEATLPDTQNARDVRTLLENNLLSSMSFGFIVKQDSWTMEKGASVRELIAVDVFEISIVCEPAYPASSVAIRSLEAFKRSLVFNGIAKAKALLAEKC